MAKPVRDVYDLIQRYLSGWSPRLILDVGANVGQSAAAYATRFPDAQIHSFEPVPETHGKLVEATKKFPNVVAHNFGLGKTSATLAMRVHGTSATNRLVSRTQMTDERMVEVQIRTGADVFSEFGADHIDFLKIDTEGHDYDVLVGFLPVLQQVDFVQVEAAMNPHNRTHVPLRLFEDLLWNQGFHLFHIFEQTMEWKRGGRPVLRRANPVFIHGRHLNLDKIS
jgi:FkbM family methyltransferase